MSKEEEDFYLYENISSIKPWDGPQYHIAPMWAFHFQTIFMGLVFFAGTPAQRHHPLRHHQVQEVEAAAQLHFGQHLPCRIYLLRLRGLHGLLVQHPRVLLLWPSRLHVGGFPRLGGRSGHWLVLGFPRLRTLHRDLQATGELPFQRQACFDCGGSHVGHRSWGVCPPLLRLEQVPSGRAAVLLRSRLVHGGHQIQERVLLLVSLRLLLHHSAHPHHLLLCAAPGRPPGAAQQQESATTQKAEREVSRMVVVMVGSFCICYTPYAALAMYMVNNPQHGFDLRLVTIPAFFSKSSCVYNPIIYCFMNKQFRGCIMETVCGKPMTDESDVASQKTEVSTVSSSQVSPKS
ncbi:short-wave-sensitive opsin 1 [Crotalus adamanteus]|uniref:Short-wave-sensitive opsin 1 n=1 Tax=Crotalus adamanteus TaxID=8729 RepID=A0AAW1BFR1_CROAD